MLEAGSITQNLLTSGLLSAEDVVDRGVEVIDASRSNPVYIFRVGSKNRFIAKQGQPQSSVFRHGLSRERTAYQLATHIPALSDLMPRSYLSEVQQPELLVTDYLGGEAAWSAEASGVVTDLQLIKALGSALGVLHRETGSLRAKIATTELPWCLTLFGDEGEAYIASHPQMRPVINQARRMPGFVDHVRRVSQIWRPSCLIHGDTKLDNCFIETRTGSNQIISIKFIDWELAVLGDPAWDLAGVLENFIVREVPIRANQRNTRHIGVNDGGWGEFIHKLANGLLQSYRIEHSITNGLIHRLPHYVAIWMFQTALRYACMPEDEQRLYHADPEPILSASEVIFINANLIAADLERAL